MLPVRTLDARSVLMLAALRDVKALCVLPDPHPYYIYIITDDYIQRHRLMQVRTSSSSV
jgi:hypothetical protein